MLEIGKWDAIRIPAISSHRRPCPLWRAGEKYFIAIALPSMTANIDRVQGLAVSTKQSPIALSEFRNAGNVFGNSIGADDVVLYAISPLFNAHGKTLHFVAILGNAS